jgi:hypothetical protein
MRAELEPYTVVLVHVVEVLVLVAEALVLEAVELEPMQRLRRLMLMQVIMRKKIQRVQPECLLMMMPIVVNFLPEIRVPIYPLVKGPMDYYSEGMAEH